MNEQMILNFHKNKIFNLSSTFFGALSSRYKARIKNITIKWSGAYEYELELLDSDRAIIKITGTDNLTSVGLTNYEEANEE